MKAIFFSLMAGVALVPALRAQNLAVEAYLIYEEGDIETAYITASSKTQVRYKETAESTSVTDVKISDIQSIYILEPPDFSNALTLFKQQKFDEARAKFAEVRKKYQPIEELIDNPSTLAAFYECECLRILGDLDGLAKAQEGIDKSVLTRETQLRQFELYSMWDAMRAKSWDRLDAICQSRLKENLPGGQRAQVGYCLGVALEARNRPLEAIRAYNIAMTADAGASRDLVKKAVESSLRLYKKDPEVIIAMELWGTKNEKKGSNGYSRLVEAGGLANLYLTSLGGGVALPNDVKDMVKYKPEEESASK